MIDVFMSYRTADAAYGAAGCYEFFAARFGPDRVFRDCTSVLPGEVYPQAIKKALEETRALVALIGPDWLVAGAEGQRLIDRPEDWVRREIGRGLERGILVVPVLLNEAGALLPSALPEDIRPLAYRQAARVHHRTFGSDVRRLIDQIVELVPELGPSDSTRATPDLPHDVLSSISPQAPPHLVPFERSGARRSIVSSDLPTNLPRTGHKGVLAAIASSVAGRFGTRTAAPRRVRSSFRAARPPFGLLDAPIRGRDAVLRQLQAIARRPDGFVGVIAAMGGVGKTTVALELCRRVEAHGYHVWWISAVDPMEISSEMLEIAREVGAAQGDIDDARAGRRNAADLVWGSLNSTSRWLLVFDNADDPSVLDSNRRSMAAGIGWARPSRSGLTLVTSRRGDVAIWGATSRVHHLGVLTAAEGAQVLLDLAPDAGSAHEAASLADRLGGLPLALHLAGSYINDDLTAIRTFAAYRHELDVRFRDLMSAADVEGIEASRRRAVTTTWEISLDDLEGRGLPHARELLQTMSFYAPATPIPGALLNTDTASGGATHGKQETAGELSISALRGLRSVGLIDVRTGESAADDKGVVVHPLVAETTFLSMSTEQREQRGRTTAALIRSSTSDLETQRPEHWPQWRIVSPHLSAIIGRRVVEPDALASLMETAGRGIWALCEFGDYGAAEDLARECIGAAGPLGADHPVVLTVRHELGGVLRERGQPAEAEAEYREVLEARVRLLGADHPATFSTLRQLSGALWDLDRLAEAEAGYRTVLAHQVQVNGADDPDTIHTRHDLAGVLASQTRFAEAQDEYESALAAGLRVLGPEHPSVLATCHQLAGVLRSRHLLDEAELTCRAALDRRTTTFGPDHVATISSLHRLGRIFQDQDLTAKAEAVYRDALDRCLRSVGVRHPLTRDVQNDLDMLLQHSTQHPE